MARVVLLFSVFCFSFISLSISLRHRLGKCKPIAGKPELDIKKLAGSWVRYAKYGWHHQGKVPQCKKVELMVEEQDDAITLVESKVYKHHSKVKESKLKPDTNAPGFVRHPVRVTNSASDESETKRTFTILDTDYKCWAATYECKQKTTKLSISYSEVKSFLWVKKSDECMKLPHRKSYLDLVDSKFGAIITAVTWENTSGC